MSFFNEAWIKSIESGEYICPRCGELMNFEDEWEETLVCIHCGFTDEKYNDLYPRKEDFD